MNGKQDDKNASEYSIITNDQRHILSILSFNSYLNGVADPTETIAILKSCKITGVVNFSPGSYERIPRSYFRIVLIICEDAGKPSNGSTQNTYTLEEWLDAKITGPYFYKDLTGPRFPSAKNIHIEHDGNEHDEFCYLAITAFFKTSSFERKLIRSWEHETSVPVHSGLYLITSRTNSTTEGLTYSWNQVSTLEYYTEQVRSKKNTLEMLLYD